MDGAGASGLHRAAAAAVSRRAATARAEARAVRPGGAAAGADLGGSSKYSNENFEGRSGEERGGAGGGPCPAPPARAGQRAGMEY